MAQIFKRLWESPVGLKTLHFWAPTANFFFAIQGLYDWNRDPTFISKEMQGILVGYSTLFMRFAWLIKPRSYILFTVHISNFFLQGRLLSKRLLWEQQFPEKALEQKHKNQLAKELAKQKNEILELKTKLD